MRNTATNIIDLPTRSEREDLRYLNDTTIVTTAFLAKLIGITERRVRQLCEEGMPRHLRGQHPLLASVQWYQCYLRRLGAAGARRAPEDHRYRVARANAAELKLALMQMTVVPKPRLKRALSSGLRELNSRLSFLAFSIARELNLPLSEIKLLRERFKDESNEYLDALYERVMRG